MCIHGGGCNSKYFDIRGFSVAKAALARGFDVLLVNRPGHGGSDPPRTNNPIAEAAARLRDHLAPIMTGRASPDVVVIGHSIGGAVALMLAAKQNIVIRGVAVSGIGRTLSDTSKAALMRSEIDYADPPHDFFFGPKGSYAWNAPMALRKVIEPWRVDDIHDVRISWPEQFDTVAAAITVPVAFHLAEYERIWRAAHADVAEAAACFTASPVVDAGVLPDGGHLYEVHKRGPELLARQFDFLHRACGS